VFCPDAQSPVVQAAAATASPRPMPFKVVIVTMELHPSCRMCRKRPFFMIL
jgi:hypothetical protein